MKLVATGDAVITRRVSQDVDPGLLELRDTVSRADAAFTNFETTTPRPPLVPSRTHGLPISSPPEVIDELRWMGFTLFGLAHNHATAFGWQGSLDTLNEFESRHLTAAGCGRTLSEARAPRYLALREGRVALISATSTNAAAVMAADPGRSTGGRPGANPLRFKIEYRLDKERFRMLSEIDEAIGTAQVRREREAFGPLVEPSPSPPGTLRFLGADFVRGDRPGVSAQLHPGDAAALERSVQEARWRSDLVIVSIHCHEGSGGAWNSDDPPDFLTEAAHRCVNAGADLIVGHGPHRLRGVEIYRGKPIFYSLGNFMLQLETVEAIPPETLEQAGLPADAAPADFHDHGWIGPDGSPIGFASDPVWFEAVVADCEFTDRKLEAIRLYPVELGSRLPRPRRGVPRLVDASQGGRILERVARLSQRFGTEVRIEAQGQRAIASLVLA